MWFGSHYFNFWFKCIPTFICFRIGHRSGYSQLCTNVKKTKVSGIPLLIVFISIFVIKDCLNKHCTNLINIFQMKCQDVQVLQQQYRAYITPGLEMPKNTKWQKQISTKHAPRVSIASVISSGANCQ